MLKLGSHHAALTLSLGFTACAGGGGDAVTEPPPATVSAARSPALLALSEVPVASVELARTLLGASRGTDLAPNWTDDARLADEVNVYERPDVEGPAYYEFGVTTGGRIVVATGRHDSPLPLFSDLGEPLARKLHMQAEARGEAVVHLYRLADQDVFATNEAGQIVADVSRGQSAVGLFIDEVVAARELAERDEAVEKAGARARAAFDAQWDELYPEHLKRTVLYDVGANLAVKDIKWLYHRDLLRTQITFDQPDLDPSSKICWAGCGPVAVAQVAAYLAFSERWGNPKYTGSGSSNLYPNVSTRNTAPQAFALIEELHYEFDSFCWTKANVLDSSSPLYNESFATPWGLDNFAPWAASKGAQVRWETSWGGPSGGDETAAWNAIRRGNPVVFGWNFEHYNVGVGAGLLNGTKYLWVNNGQANADFDGWMPYDKNSMFFSGIVQSWVAGK